MKSTSSEPSRFQTVSDSSIKEQAKSEDDKNECQENKNQKEDIGIDKLWSNQVRLFLGVMISYDEKIEKFLRKESEQKVEKSLNIIRDIPGYKPQQLVFLFYLQTHGAIPAFTVSFLYPLIPCILFYLTCLILQLVHPERPFLFYCFQIASVGLRCSLVAYLLRNSINFKASIRQWINIVGAIGIGLFVIVMNSTQQDIANLIGIYMVFALIVFFWNANYKQEKNSQKDDNNSKQQINEIEQLPKVRPLWSITALLLLLCIFWTLGNETDPKAYGQLLHFSIVSWMPHYHQTILIFYPLAINALPFHQMVYTADLYALGFLLPGSYLQSFFLILKNNTIYTLILSYIALYLPSLLLLNIYFSLKHKINPSIWRILNELTTWLTKGLIMITIFRLVGEEVCHINIVFFTGIVIFAITRLYSLDELLSGVLGIFLVTSRVIALYLVHGKNMKNFVCMADPSIIQPLPL